MCVIAVLAGAISCQLLLQLFWWLLQNQELRVRQWRRKANTARKAVGGRSFYATHSPRKLTWAPPSVFRRTFWVVTVILTIIGLFFVPRMPDLVPFHSHSYATTPSPDSVRLPPVPKFAPPQWFDPPHRDQVLWLKTVAKVVQHSARVSWQVLTSSLPATDGPVQLPADLKLNGSSASDKVEPFNKAASLQLNTTTCINPDAEAWPVKGRRHPTWAPAMTFSDHGGWHHASVYRTTMTDTAATQLEPDYLIVSLPYMPKSLTVIQVPPVNIAAAAASDGRYVADGSCSTDPSTAVAIQPPSAHLQSFTTMLVCSDLAPLQSSPTDAACSPLELLHSPTGFLRSLLAPMHSSTALAVWTPLQCPALQGSCPATDEPTAALTSPDYTMAVEVANSLAELSPAVTAVAAGTSPTIRLASSSLAQPQCTSPISNTSQKISLRPQSPLTDSHPLVAAPEVDPFILLASMNIVNNTTQSHPVPAASHQDAASRHWNIKLIGFGTPENDLIGGQITTDSKQAHISFLMHSVGIHLSHTPKPLLSSTFSWLSQNVI